MESKAALGIQPLIVEVVPGIVQEVKPEVDQEVKPKKPRKRKNHNHGRKAKRSRAKQEPEQPVDPSLPPHPNNVAGDEPSLRRPPVPRKRKARQRNSSTCRFQCTRRRRGSRQSPWWTNPTNKCYLHHELFSRFMFNNTRKTTKAGQLPCEACWGWYKTTPFFHTAEVLIAVKNAAESKLAPSSKKQVIAAVASELLRCPRISRAFVMQRVEQTYHHASTVQSNTTKVIQHINKALTDSGLQAMTVDKQPRHNSGRGVDQYTLTLPGASLFNVSLDSNPSTQGAHFASVVHYDVVEWMRGHNRRQREASHEAIGLENCDPHDNIETVSTWNVNVACKASPYLHNRFLAPS